MPSQVPEIIIEIGDISSDILIFSLISNKQSERAGL